jgi:hypothetical protein
VECLDLVHADVAKVFQQLVSWQGGTGLVERLPTGMMAGRVSIPPFNPADDYRCLAQFELPSEPRVASLQVLAFIDGRIVGLSYLIHQQLVAMLVRSASGLIGTSWKFAP